MTMRDAVLARGDTIQRIARAHRMSRVRVFGSVARGDDDDASDVDLLVTAEAGCDLFEIAEAERAIAELLGRKVDVRTVHDLHPKIRDGVVAEAIEL